MPSHLVTVAISVFMFIYIPFKIRKNPQADWVNYFCKILGLLLIGNELGWILYKYNTIGGTWAEYMPFELCTINAYLLGFLLIFHPAYAVFEVVYFFSLAGTVQGIITPRLFAAFPHYLFWEYFITHTGIVLGALVLIFRYNWKVTWLSLWRAFFWLQVIAFFNLVFLQNVFAFIFAIWSHKKGNLGTNEKTSIEGIIAPGVLTLLSALLCYGLADKIYY